MSAERDPRLLKPIQNVGIVGYGAYIPRYRLPAREIARVWKAGTGSLPIEEIPRGVKRIIDVKCPGSGESERNRWENLEDLRKTDELKFVIADREDYSWASAQVESRRLLQRCPVLFSPVQELLDPAQLAEWILADRLGVRLQVQLHKLLWPGVERGV